MLETLVEFHHALLVFSANRVGTTEDVSGVCSSLVELLERESQSEVFVKGISYAMFKVAERGLVDAAKILLRYGADLNFEGEFSLNNVSFSNSAADLLFYFF